MASQRGVDRDIRRLGVAHFADHDDVGVKAHERAHGRGECQADRRLDLDWFIPGISYSIGSSIVRILRKGVFSADSMSRGSSSCRCRSVR